MKKLFFFAAYFIFPFLVHAQWSNDSTVRNVVCNAANEQYYPRACSDGKGGAIFAWIDERPPNNSYSGLYVQRIDVNGNTKWANNGIPVFEYVSGSNILDANTEQIVSDGNGGAIIVYSVQIIGGVNHIYAQRIDSTGTKVWASDVAVATNYDSRLRATEEPDQDNVSADGNGGVFVTWQSYLSDAFIRAQHINADGSLAWGTNDGIGISGSVAGYDSHINSTGNGTAIVTYSNGYNLYLQRIDASGNFLWGANGMLVSSLFSGEYGGSNPPYHAAFDGTNLLLCYIHQHNNTPATEDLFVQKFDLNGNALWSGDGLSLAASADDESSPYVLPDYNGGYFVAYDSAGKIKAQLLNSNGQLQWGATGITVNKVNYSGELNPVLTADGNGGIIVLFQSTNNPEPIWAQRYTAGGTALWEPTCYPVITDHADVNHNVAALIPSDPGYAISCWHDERDPLNHNIYAAKFGGSNGLLPVHFISFNAIVSDETVLLKWTVEQQLNVQSYTVQRSHDGRNFSDIVTIPAEKNNMQLNYQTADDHPLQGANYYRIQETDKDGKQTYSAIRIASIHASINKLYPNPSHDKIEIAVNSVGTSNSIITVYALDGKKLLQKNIQIVQGYNLVTIDVSSLAKGIYTIQMPGTDIRPMKFVKN